MVPFVNLVKLVKLVHSMSLSSEDIRFAPEFRTAELSTSIDRREADEA